MAIGFTVGAVTAPIQLITGDLAARNVASDRPANVVHLAFQLMVGIGMSLLALPAFSGWKRWRSGDFPTATWWYWAVAASGPASVLALEAGWTTTEVGRQPWIAQQVMLVEDAVTPRDGIGLVLAGFVVVYLGLGLSALFVLRSMSARWRAGGDPPAPYGPNPTSFGCDDGDVVAVAGR